MPSAFSITNTTAKGASILAEKYQIVFSNFDCIFNSESIFFLATNHPTNIVISIPPSGSNIFDVK